MSHRPEKCDACDRRIRRSHHALRLSDLATGQVLGRYHAGGSCRDAAIKYFEPGAVIRVTVLHPQRCGPEQERCDLGAMEELVA